MKRVCIRSHEMGRAKQAVWRLVGHAKGLGGAKRGKMMVSVVLVQTTEPGLPGDPVRQFRGWQSAM